MITYALVSFLLILISYWGLFTTFFQQDEWFTLGIVSAQGPWAGLYDYSIAELLLGTGRVLGSFIGNVFHYLFPLDIAPFVMFALVVHGINGMLIYRFVYYVTRNPRLAFVSGVIFVIGFIPHQAITWTAASVTTLGATFFALLAITVHVGAYTRKSSRLRFLAFGLLIVSALFKDITIPLFIYLPATAVILARGKLSARRIVTDNWPILLYLICIMALRIAGFASDDGKKGVFITKHQNPTQRLVVHALLYPVVSMGNMYVPPTFMYKLANRLQADHYRFLAGAPLSEAIMQNLASDLVSLILGAGFVGSIFILWYVNKNQRRIILWSFLFCVVSFLPYSIVERGSSYLDSRYYYLPFAGGAILMGILIDAILAWWLRSRSITVRMLLGVCIIGAVIYGYKNIVQIRRAVATDQKIAQERKIIISGIRSIIVRYPHGRIFYVTGDSEHYALAGQALPFQQNIGYTIMVLMAREGRVYKEPLIDISLFQIGRQWQKMTPQGTVGYYWNMDVLRQAVRSKQVKPEEIIGLSYDSKNRQLLDITSRVTETALNEL